MTSPLPPPPKKGRGRPPGRLYPHPVRFRADDETLADIALIAEDYPDEASAIRAAIREKAERKGAEKPQNSC